MDSCTFLPHTPGSTIHYGNEEADTNEKERLLSFSFHPCSIPNHHPRHLTRHGQPFSKADILSSLALKDRIIIFSPPGILKLPFVLHDVLLVETMLLPSFQSGPRDWRDGRNICRTAASPSKPAAQPRHTFHTKSVVRAIRSKTLSEHEKLVQRV